MQPPDATWSELQHELTNLLAVVVTHAQLALRADPDDDLRDGLQEIHRAAARAIDLVDASFPPHRVDCQR